MEVYFDSQKNNQKNYGSRVKLYLAFLFLGLFLIFFVYALVYSPLFQVRKFSIKGNSRLSSEAVLNIMRSLVSNNKLENFLGANNLLIWDKKVDVSKSALLKAIINRSWVNQSVTINIEERNQSAIWCKTDFCYWIDDEGIAFEEAPRTEGPLVLMVYDDGQEGIIRGQKVVDERYAANLSAILRGILNLGISVKNIEFNERLQEIKIMAHNSPDLLFSIRFNPELNMAALYSLKEKVGLRGINYIDLRVENRIYYKN